MELTEINIEEINSINELIKVSNHAQNVIEKVEASTAAYSGFTNFPFLNAELKEDGLVYMTLSKDESQPVTTLSPGDFNNMMIHLRDVYFPSLQAFAENLRNEAIAKTNTIITVLNQSN